MIACTVLPTSDLDASMRRLIRDELTKPDSDFHHGVETKTAGLIAIVMDDEVVVGWARTEQWYDGNGIPFDTLEAFVRPERRMRGIAGFAASGLYSAVFHASGCAVAVFSPYMMLVARRAGLFPTLFERDGNGHWRRA
jgi:hypothetical protein